MTLWQSRSRIWACWPTSGARAAVAGERARIHVLVNNAGVLLNRRTTTAEGNEATLATNLLAPFLLTQLLLPRLRKSAPSRIINVSSGGMYTAAWPWTICSTQRRPTTQSRLCTHQARAGRPDRNVGGAAEKSGVVVHAMHPGWRTRRESRARCPDSTRHPAAAAHAGARGDTITWLAASPEAARTSGVFWLDREPARHPRPSRHRSDAEERQQLWRRSPR